MGIQCKSRKIEIVNLHRSGLSLDTISRCLKVPGSSVQTGSWKLKQYGNIQSLYHSGPENVFGTEIMYQPFKKSKILWDDAG